MATRITRRKIAAYVAGQLQAGSTDILQQLAAYLVESNRTREASLIVREIKEQLMHHGVVAVDVVSARDLSRELRHAIEKFIASQYADARVELQSSVERSLIGGIQIYTPDAVFDSSLRTRLTNLKASKL